MFTTGPILPPFPRILHSPVDSVQSAAHSKEPSPMCVLCLIKGSVLTPFPRVLHSSVNIIQSTPTVKSPLPPPPPPHVCALSVQRPILTPFPPYSPFSRRHCPVYTPQPRANLDVYVTGPILPPFPSFLHSPVDFVQTAPHRQKPPRCVQCV